MQVARQDGENQTVNNRPAPRLGLTGFAVLLVKFPDQLFKLSADFPQSGAGGHGQVIEPGVLCLQARKI